MDERRAYLKQLAARSARRWSSAPLPECFVGETRIDTRNTCYQLRDGICYAVTRHEGGGGGQKHPSEFVGMRIVGWLMRETPRQGIMHEWQPGAYAVLWRPREGDEAHSAVALTSTTQSFRTILRVAPPPTFAQPITTRQGRVPPPPPMALPRGSLLPRPMTPSPWVPSPPETPTPPRRSSSVPPALPPTSPGGRRPLSLRTPIAS
jgi:hypothetical protein